MALALAALCAAAVAGCAREAPRLDVHARLFPPGEKRYFGERSECAVDDDLRPALGCARLIGSRPAADGATATSGATAGSGPVPATASAYRVPAAVAGKLLVVRRVVRPSVYDPWEHLDPIVRTSADGFIDVPLPEDAKEREVYVYLPGEGPREWRSAPVPIPAGATLEGAVALDTLVPRAVRAPVAFAVRAVTAEGETELLRVERTAGDPSGWHDYRIDLGALAEREVTFVLVAMPLAADARAGERATGAGDGTADATGAGSGEEDASGAEDATSVGRVAWAADGAGSGDAPVFAPLWSRPLLVAPARTKRPSFLVISIDTLRADHVGVYGSPLPTTPILDGRAGDAVVFSDASTTYPSTTASHMSLMTGLHPSSHGVYFPGTRLDGRIPTLAELLSGAGYRTAAVTENGMIVSIAGFLRGFDTYEELKARDTSEQPGWVAEVVDRGLDWLARHRDEDFFLFLHTYQVHTPYEPPEAFDRFGGEVRAPRDAYAGEVLYMDSEIGRLLDGLEAGGLDERTVVVLTADHGEGFGEHDVVGHGHALFEELMRIPLVVWDPSEPGRRVDVPVSLVDVTPTLLELAGVAAPTASQGRSLVALLRGGTVEDPERPVFAERRLHDGRLATAVRKGKRKWIFGEPLRPDRVFDLASDPGEATNLATPELLAEGRVLVDALRSQARSVRTGLGEGRAKGRAKTKTNATRRDVDARTENALRALGYVESPEGGWAPLEGGPTPSPTGLPGSG